MRHRKFGRKLGRNSAHLRALFRNMAASLVLHGRIETTIAKAKELRTYVEPLITKAIRLRRELPAGSRKLSAEQQERGLHLRRLIAARLPQAATMKGEDGDRLLNRRELVAYLLEEIAPRYLKRPGGYTRIRRLGFRKGDNAPLAILELVPGEAVKSESHKEAAPEKKKKASFFRRGKAEAAAEDEKRDARVGQKPARPARQAAPKVEKKVERRATKKGDR
ncbi:MAG: 50S ribosomal protein L17 [Deltaproteobacteria bacterium]|nr:50S ribosomal protein L17 [Deltaproteobacteria bacterium]